MLQSQLDAVTEAREVSGSSSVYTRILSTLLNEMDGNELILFPCNTYVCALCITACPSDDFSLNLSLVLLRLQVSAPEHFLMPKRKV